MQKYLIAHPLSRDLALRATHTALTSYSQRFKSHDPKFLWESQYRVRFAFDVKGHTVDGLIEVRDHDIEIDMHVPLLFRMFETPALAIVTQEINAWAAKVQAGQN